MVGRIPPPTPEYLRFLEPFSPAIAGLALAVLQLVLDKAKGAVELIYDAYNAVASGYSFTGRPSDARASTSQSMPAGSTWVLIALPNCPTPRSACKAPATGSATVASHRRKT